MPRLSLQTARNAFLFMAMRVTGDWGDGGKKRKKDEGWSLQWPLKLPKSSISFISDQMRPDLEILSECRPTTSTTKMQLRRVDGGGAVLISCCSHTETLSPLVFQSFRIPWKTLILLLITCPEWEMVHSLEQWYNKACMLGVMNGFLFYFSFKKQNKEGEPGHVEQADFSICLAGESKQKHLMKSRLLLSLIHAQSGNLKCKVSVLKWSSPSRGLREKLNGEPFFWHTLRFPSRPETVAHNLCDLSVGRSSFECSWNKLISHHLLSTSALRFLHSNLPFTPGTFGGIIFFIFFPHFSTCKLGKDMIVTSVWHAFCQSISSLSWNTWITADCLRVTGCYC